jgi:hypothetical protein
MQRIHHQLLQSSIFAATNWVSGNIFEKGKTQDIESRARKE